MAGLRFRTGMIAGVLACAVATACGGDDFSSGGSGGSGAAAGTGGVGATAGVGGAGGEGGSQAGSGGSSSGAGGEGASAGSGAVSGAGGSGASGAGGSGANGGAGATGGNGGAGAAGGNGGTGGVMTGGAAGTGGTGGGLTFPLEDFCEETASIVCEALEGCCSDNFGYNKANCEIIYKAECANDVLAVSQGKKTYHPQFIDECYSALAGYYDACRPTIQDYIIDYQELRACNLVFQGMAQPGELCGKDSDCAQPANQHQTASCGGLLAAWGLGTCSIVSINPQGAGCALNLGEEYALCEDGLYCKPDDPGGGQPNPTGTCVPRVELGDPCEIRGELNIECGIGAFCAVPMSGGTQGTCVESRGGEAMCSAAGQCDSLSCTFGTCEFPELIVDAETCGVGG